MVLKLKKSKLMRNALLLCCFLMVSALFQDANAQRIPLRCTNQTALPVWIAVAYNHIPDLDSKDTWVCEGWLYIEPRDTVVLSRHMGFDRTDGIKTNFFYYAYQVGQGAREWKGIRKFLVDISKPSSKDEFEFSISRAHKLDDNPNHKRYHFKAGVLGAPGADPNARPKDMIVLRQSDRNDVPDKSSGVVKAPSTQPAATPFSSSTPSHSVISQPSNQTNMPTAPAPAYKGGGFKRGGYSPDVE